jgi:polar amino acid transport system permease protein
VDQPQLTELTPGRPEEIEAVPVRRPGRWIAAFIVVVIAASVIRFAVTDSAIQWHIVGHYLFNSEILDGVVVTLYLAVLAMLMGVILGVILAVMRLSPNPILKSASWLYIYFFRATPLLVQIVFWYNIAALFPHGAIGIGIPFGPALAHPDASALVTVFVPEGQAEAAASLGMSRLQIMRRIVLPQAMRVILPPTGNEFISMLKNTALAETISLPELYYRAQSIYSQNYDTVQLLIVISIWYMAMTSIAYVGQYFLERKFGQGFSRTQRILIKDRWLALSRNRGAGL